MARSGVFWQAWQGRMRYDELRYVMVRQARRVMERWGPEGTAGLVVAGLVRIG